MSPAEIVGLLAFVSFILAMGLCMVGPALDLDPDGFWGILFYVLLFGGVVLLVIAAALSGDGSSFESTGRETWR